MFWPFAVRSMHIKDCYDCPDGASVKEHTCQWRSCKRRVFNPWVRKIPWRGNGNPLLYSCLENPMDRGAWKAIVRRVARSRNMTETKHTHRFLKNWNLSLLCKASFHPDKFPCSESSFPEINIATHIFFWLVLIVFYIPLIITYMYSYIWD